MNINSFWGNVISVLVGGSLEGNGQLEVDVQCHAPMKPRRLK